MKQRCYNPNCKKYNIYGKRGIIVSDSWRDSYDTFLSDMGLKPDGYTIDRIDNNGNYSKENCKWSTPKEQARNRRTNRYIEFDGKTLTITEWAEEIGVFHHTISKRLELGWKLVDVLSPIKHNSIPVEKTIKIEVLRMYFNKEASQKTIAKLFGISQGVISKWVVKERKNNGNK